MQMAKLQGEEGQQVDGGGEEGAGTKSATVDIEWDVDLKQLAQPINGNKPRRDATQCGARQDEARQGKARRLDAAPN